MTVAILGTGIVGQTLAGGLLKHGYDVIFGTQHTNKKIESKDPALKTINILPYADAAAAGDLIVLCVKGTAAKDVVRTVAAQIEGKTVIDTTNPIADAAPTNGVLAYFTTFDRSLMEQLQELAPGAHFVKAFNSVGNAFMVHPDFGKERPTMFICGNDARAKRDAAKIAETFGFEVEDMGMAEAARAIEPLCILWCIPGLLRNEWGHAFKLLKKT